MFLLYFFFLVLLLFIFLLCLLLFFSFLLLFCSLKVPYHQHNCHKYIIMETKTTKNRNP